MAAVAVVFHEGDDGLDLLFVKRCAREGGRWSGDVAFPGGLSEEGETEPAQTARREAREEVGISLGEPVGRLSAHLTVEPRRARPMRVVPVVFSVDERPPLVLEPAEIAEAFWVPWSVIEQAQTRWLLRTARRLPMLAPSIRIHGYPLWGLTLQMVWGLSRRLG